MGENEQAIRCELCEQTLIQRKVTFHYLGQFFSTELPACPVCGQVYIPEALARGRMAEVEMELEDK